MDVQINTPASRPKVGPRPRVGVLGTGYWARWCHGTELAARPDVEFVGFWGRDADKAHEAANAVGGFGTSDLDVFLEQVDCVSVALPPTVQGAMIPAIARRGVHMLLDKPLALDVDVARQAVEAIRAANVSTVSFMTLRMQPQVERWLSEMTSIAKTCGPWIGLDIVWAGSIDEPGSPYAGSKWRQQKGGLWDLGPHALSLTNGLFGPALRVQAIAGRHDTVHVSLRHAEEAISTLTLSVRAPSSAHLARMEVWGPGGRHSLELPLNGLREAYSRAFDRLLDSIGTGTADEFDAAFGASIVTTLDEAEKQIAAPS